MTSFLSPDAAAALAALTALESGAGEAAPLDRLRGIRALVVALEADPAALVAAREAVDAGASWDDIADAAGLSASAAKYRWAGDDDTIADRQEASRRRKRERPSSVPTDLPGESVSEAARRLGLTPQAIYQRVTRGLVEARTITLPDGRSYKRVFLTDPADPDGGGADATGAGVGTDTTDRVPPAEG
ncbi:hypothetical protein [Agromyces sp. Leaf222]|uniref:hypothetical protein n=1 Tax=Agromyces sp. Leaf222 TaxID=1735688 RepID=UPI0006FB2C76|nr:hypothetical protein [Agromyces sp. Leaf222]KQM82976.1 hypothetical protein ASE68_06685 [Agromyces sp. Leaf222]